MVGLKAADALLTVDSTGHIYVPIENHNSISARLEPGVFLGSVSSVAEPVYDGSSADSEEVPLLGKVNGVSEIGKEEREEKLLSILGLDQGCLPDDHFLSLKKLICANTDVFTLEDEKLGHTDLVQHQVNTGDHPPIKQHARRVPFC